MGKTDEIYVENYK